MKRNEFIKTLVLGTGVLATGVSLAEPVLTTEQEIDLFKKMMNLEGLIVNYDASPDERFISMTPIDKNDKPILNKTETFYFDDWQETYKFLESVSAACVIADGVKRQSVSILNLLIPHVCWGNKDKHLYIKRDNKDREGRYFYYFETSLDHGIKVRQYWDDIAFVGTKLYLLDKHLPVWTETHL